MQHHEGKFSKLGYILTMAGSAIGLGTAWKFPTMTGQNGGFAFIFLYVVLCLLIGAAAFLAESVLGRSTGKDSKGAIYELAPAGKNVWSQGGYFFIVSILIVPFYLVVVGWIFYYMLLCVSTLPAELEVAKTTFGSLISNNIFGVSVCFLTMFILSIFVVSKGIKKGIEKLNFILMPSLFLLLILLVFYSAFYGNFAGAINFIFTPDFSKIFNADLLLKALGLAMFSMSLGMGTVCTYAASTTRRTNLMKSVFYIIGLNTAVGILMGLVVFSFIPAANASEGPGLIFVSLASLFGSLGVAGQFVGFAFFAALIFAGVTSAVSIIEPTVLHLMNHHGISRNKAVKYSAIFIFIVGFICIFSYYAPSSAYLTFFGKPVFDLLDFTTSNILMPLGALFFSIFVGWVAPRWRVYAVFVAYAPRWLIGIWYWLLRIVVPVSIIVVGAYNFI